MINQTLEDYLKINKDKENIIANLLVNTGSHDYAFYEGDGIYSLRGISGLNILIIESCYLLYSIKESKDVLYWFLDKNTIAKDAYKLLLNNKEIIFIETIYSFEEGKGHAQKTIDGLKDIGIPIITDTYTAQLAHLCQKNKIPLIKDRTNEDLEYKYFKL